MENGESINFHTNKTDNSKSSFPLFFLWEKNVNLQPIFSFGKYCCINGMRFFPMQKKMNIYQ